MDTIYYKLAADTTAALPLTMRVRILPQPAADNEPHATMLALVVFGIATLVACFAIWRGSRVETIEQPEDPNAFRYEEE